MSAKTVLIILITISMTLLLLGCGGSSSSSSTSSGSASGTPQAVAISFTPAPPATIPVGTTTTVTAVVTNDPSNSGVDWALTCTNKSNCGTLSPLHTASGEPATYTPPSSLNANSQSVNIVAFATADHNKNVFTTLGITGFGSTVAGPYVLQTRGVDATGQTYHFAGVVVLDGNGNVTSGEQTYTNVSMSVSDAITGGSYAIGQDGRGTLTLNTANQNIGQLGIEVFNLVLLTNSNLLIAKIDDPNLNAPSTSTATGTMESQTSTAAPTAGYAFAVHGTDIATFSDTAFGGVINIDSPGGISGNGSVADQDVAGAVTTNSTVSGTVSAPDAFGAVKFNLTPGFASLPVQFTGYIVDGTHIKLIECDNTSGAGFGSTSGVAIGQGAATGTFTSNAAFSGNYVVGILGEDAFGLPATFSLAAQMVSDGVGTLNGSEDEFFGDLLIGISDQFSAPYSVDPNGTGRIDTFVTFLNNGPGPEYIFYLTGNGTPPLMLNFDVNIGSVGAGVVYPQAAAPFSFTGKYGLNYTQSLFGSEDDAVGEMTVDPNAATVTGIVNTNFFFSPIPDTPLTGTFTGSTTNLPFPGTLDNPLFLVTPITINYYLIDSTNGYFVETDGLSTGLLTFGYFAQRTPICSTCP